MNDIPDSTRAVKSLPMPCRPGECFVLERLMHKEFDEFRVNKVNYRKEFFRVTLERIRRLAEEKGLEVSFTMMAEARDCRETLALERMSQSERERYQSKWQEADTLSPDLE